MDWKKDSLKDTSQSQGRHKLCLIYFTFNV
jgi:hypothetical protein